MTTVVNNYKMAAMQNIAAFSVLKTFILVGRLQGNRSIICVMIHISL